jgi:hypothetical protein
MKNNYSIELTAIEPSYNTVVLSYTLADKTGIDPSIIRAALLNGGKVANAPTKETAEQIANQFRSEGLDVTVTEPYVDVNWLDNSVQMAGKNNAQMVQPTLTEVPMEQTDKARAQPKQVLSQWNKKQQGFYQEVKKTNQFVPPVSSQFTGREQGKRFNFLVALAVIAFLYLLAVAYHAHRILFDSSEIVYLHQPSTDSFFTGWVDASIIEPKELWNPFYNVSYNFRSISSACYAGKFQDLVASYERDLQLRRADPVAWGNRLIEKSRSRLEDLRQTTNYLDQEFTDIHFYFRYGLQPDSIGSPLLKKYTGDTFLRVGDAIVVRHFVDGRAPQADYLSEVVLVGHWQLDEYRRTIMYEILDESQNC